MWLKFLKFLLIPLVAALVGAGGMLYGIIRAGYLAEDIQPKAHTQQICPSGEQK